MARIDVYRHAIDEVHIACDAAKAADQMTGPVQDSLNQEQTLFWSNRTRLDP